MRVQPPLPDALTSITDALLHGQGEADLRRAAHNTPPEAQAYIPMLRQMTRAYAPVEPSEAFMRDLKTELLTGKPRPVRRPAAGKNTTVVAIPRIPATVGAFAGGAATLGIVLIVLSWLGNLLASRSGQTPRPVSHRPTGQ